MKTHQNHTDFLKDSAQTKISERTGHIKVPGKFNNRHDMGDANIVPFLSFLILLIVLPKV